MEIRRPSSSSNISSTEQKQEQKSETSIKQTNTGISKAQDSFATVQKNPLIETYLQHQERLEKDLKVNEAEARIKELEQGIKDDFAMLKKLQQQLVDTRSEKPSAEQAEKIHKLSQQIDQVEDDIKNKQAEIKKQKDLIKELETGAKKTGENAKPPQNIG